MHIARNDCNKQLLKEIILNKEIFWSNEPCAVEMKSVNTIEKKASYSYWYLTMNEEWLVLINQYWNI
jgi:hypothetical protein